MSLALGGVNSMSVRQPKRWSRCSLIGFALVCSSGCYEGPPDPEVEGVQPSELGSLEATPITILGQHFFARIDQVNLDDPEESIFYSGFEAWLRGERGDVVLENVTRVDYSTLSAVVPAGTPVGRYAVEVMDPREKRAVLEDALSVVDRAEPPATAVVQTDLQVWFRADRGTTVDGSDLLTWEDQSGNSRDARSASGRRPELIPNNPEVGDLPTVRFTDDEMSFDGSFIPESDYTVFVVAGRNGTNLGNFYFGGSGFSRNGSLIAGYEDETTLRLSQYANNLDAAVPSKAAGRQWNLDVFWLDGTTGHGILHNGATVATDTNTRRVTSWTDSTLGHFPAWTTYFDGDLAEVVMYDRMLTCDERVAIEAELATRWSLNWSTPGCP